MTLRKSSLGRGRGYMRSAGSYIGGIIGITALLGIIIVTLVILVNYQFKIYQKKYGPQMTVWDYLFDTKK